MEEEQEEDEEEVYDHLMVAQTLGFFVFLGFPIGFIGFLDLRIGLDWVYWVFLWFYWVLGFLLLHTSSKPNKTIEKPNILLGFELVWRMRP